ncbi:GNAT family N-acetyltransferase [Tannerella serpentiformis]|uniref:GNAT family N-acetyltransferase n=1 Tax=Tannerella serpentiformis TaxID=712710 RepID=UPI0008409E3E|nr:GNAT family N-acetyltransferase [Tannerella serpentiformis]AOH40881.1 GNAT family N-acetyltransferase [Tannerella serpentiformis]AVV52548.1 GNAT family N-acetyltransferase [Tannerella serpentiformis]
MIRDPRLPAMMRLWQDTFGDSDAFVRLFFTRVYRPQNALTLSRDGRLAAMLHIVPYRLRVGRRTLPAAYICGVSTRPEARGQGLMTALMRRALRTMRRRGFALTTLIPAEPWLFDVYARLGYVHPIQTCDERIATADLPLAPPDVRIAPCTDARFYAAFDRLERRRPCAILHTARDFDTIRLDCESDGGRVLVALADGRPAGFLFEAPEEGGVVRVKELLAEDADTETALLRAAATRHGATQLRIRRPPQPDRPSQPYGLAARLDDRLSAADIDRLHMALMLD